MNRLGDLQSTLEKNLSDNLASSAQVEFVVIGFDRDDATERWVRDEFPEPLGSGYLRFYRSAALQSWHFGRAKNAFRDLMRGRIYASLDGDNFTGLHGGAHIIDVFKANDHNCVFHQFQGDWGDGTCGRVSMTAEDYRLIGYDDSFLPRQWDELDAMLSILTRQRGRRYVCYRGKSIIRKSRPFARFLEENAITPTVVELPPESDPLHSMIAEAAVGKHKSTYVEEDPKLKYSSVYNHLLSYCKNTASDELRSRYVAELVEASRSMSERISPQVLEGWFLDQATRRDLTIGADEVVLVACLKNERQPQPWLEHYRRLGVTRFLLVDDGSQPPLASQVQDPDVWIWTPRVGQFRFAKAFWLELLIKCHASGRWVLTVDADEFLELPLPWPDSPAVAGSSAAPALRGLIEHAEQQQLTYFAGFLLDLMPGPDAFEAVNQGALLSRSDFGHYQYRPALPADVYLQSGTVKWSYGAHAPWAYRIDVRFRLNRAFDSLRKFPFFKAPADFHLNQGFHDLILEGAKRSPADLARTDLLPLLHYKLQQSQHDAREAGLRPTDAYHPETRANLERLRASLRSVLRQAVMSPFSHPFLGYELMPLPSVAAITLKITAQKDVATRTYGERLKRRASIPVVRRPGAVRFDRGVLYAADLDAAIEWLVRHTPYGHVHERDERVAKLATAPAKTPTPLPKGQTVAA